MSQPLNLLNTMLYFGQTQYDEYFSLIPQFPGFSIHVSYNEITQLHDLILTYHESETVSEIKHVWSAGITPPP